MTIFHATIIFVYYFTKLFQCLSVIGRLLAWPCSGVKMHVCRRAKKANFYRQFLSQSFRRLHTIAP